MWWGFEVVSFMKQWRIIGGDNNMFWIALIVFFVLFAIWVFLPSNFLGKGKNK